MPAHRKAPAIAQHGLRGSHRLLQPLLLLASIVPLVACQAPSPAGPGHGAGLAAPAADGAAAAARTLAPTGALRVAVYPGSPTSMLAASEAERREPARGLTVELGRAMAARLGVPVQWVVLQRAAELTQALKEGRADLTLTNASAERALEVDFPQAVLGLESGYLVPAASPLRRAEEVDRAGSRIGVTQGSSSERLLRGQIRQATLVVVPDVVRARAMLERGELEAFATNKAILFDMADRLGGARVLDGQFASERIAAAVPKGREAGHAWLRAFVRQAQREGLLREAAARAGLRGATPVAD